MEHHHHHYTDPLTKQDLACAVEKIMEAITQFAARVRTEFGTIRTGITSLKDKITQLQNTPDGWTPADQELLNAIEAEASTLGTATAQPPVPQP